MVSPATAADPSKRNRFSATERACAWTWPHAIGSRAFPAHRSIYTHISARVPGPEAHFLINAYGLLFDEIQGRQSGQGHARRDIVDDPSGLGINPAGYLIHSAVHRARHDVGCVMHTHTTAAWPSPRRSTACCR